MELDLQPKPTGTLSRILLTLVLCVTVFLFFQLISLYLSWQKQAILGAVSIAVGVVIDRASRSRLVTLALMLVSLMATFRYGWWRVHTLVEYFRDQSNRRFSLDAALMFLLIGAEVYTVIIMLLGYMQTAWPLQRKPIPMPPDESLWPDVDVYIPTYNEPLSLVRYTALAAMNIDYPPDKLHIYILDDGTREDFKAFCAEAGVGYATRPTHPHAKAGNINHALEITHSPYVAIFDCDHVPTRSFLQMTMGWMLADEKLAMLQTPHHFYSPDPFERNLLQYKSIPNEGELFYGIVQDGNDFWNATFFCGSCALIRRSALDEIGGVATETVTEDAHTSLRLQRNGYNTAYINIPQAAGLATETLAAHVGQRIRWARGMIQILRTDNPLFGRGLKLSQRLCYFNAMAHFMYAVPRLVFLMAPLAYLLLGRTIIPGYWVAIVVYALPHLFLASLTNSRVQSWHRHSFWNEIYESVLAPYILLPTVLALIDPKLGKFNVTAKGSTLSQTQFDRKISAPTRWMLLLNFLGLAIVPYKLLVSDPQHPGAVCMNLLWVLFNIVILGVAAAVANEQKQRRESVRIEVRIGARIELPDGRIVDGETTDMSVGGASIRVSEDLNVRQGSIFAVSFPHVSGDEQVRAKLVSGPAGTIRVAFLVPTIAEQETLARTLYSRADAWIVSPAAREADRPLVSLGRVIVLSGQGLYRIFKSMLPEKRAVEPAVPAQTTAAVLLLAFALGAASHARAAQSAAITVAHSSPAALSNQTAKPGAAAVGDSGTDLSTASQVLSFRELDLESPIEMRGPHSYYSLHFTLSHALVPNRATLKLLYTIDPTLDPRSTLLRVSVNGVAVTTLAPHPNQAPGSLSTAALSIPEWVLVRSNTIAFEFVGATPSEPQRHERVFCRIFPESKLEVSGARLRLENDLSKLPLPILDSDLESETAIPFVFLEPPDRVMLQAAGIVASWFGIEAGVRSPRFSVSLAAIPPGNAVLFLNRRTLVPSGVQLPAAQGAHIALRPNPSDPYATLLIIAGDGDAQLLSAASSLALTGKTVAAIRGGGPVWHGDTAAIPALALPPARGKDDAPRWMQAGKVNAVASCQPRDLLQTDGSNPVRAYFHVPPDLFYGEEQTVDLRLNYRYDARQVAAGSALRTYVNGDLVNEIPLPPGVRASDGQRLILVPVASLRPFGNTILFNFDFVAANRDPSESSQLSGSIRCDSTLDLRNMKLWTEMPNLELFANAGFPFTQRADLAQTAIVLPSDPSAGEIMLYLQLMGHFGEQTGFPALRFALADPSAEIQAGRDYLVLGALGNQPAFRALDSLLPVTFDKAGLHVKSRSGLSSSVASVEDTAWRWGDDLLHLRQRKVTAPASGMTADAMVEEVRSPASPDRSIVVVEMASDGAEAGFAQALAERSQSTDMSGSLSLLRNARFASYSLDQPAYHVGDLSWYATMRVYLARHFLLLLLAVTGLCFLVARLIYEWMAAHARQRLSLSK